MFYTIITVLVLHLAQFRHLTILFNIYKINILTAGSFFTRSSDSDSNIWLRSVLCCAVNLKLC